MRKNFAYGVSVVALLGVIVAVFGQPPTPTGSPTATPTPTTPSVLISTATPTPTPTNTPNESGTVAVPSSLTTPTPTPLPTPISTAPGAVERSSSLEWSEKGAPNFTIDKAVITALQQNPDVSRALEEIRRTKGVVIQIRAQALPHIGPSATFDWTDPNLRENTAFSTFGQVGPTPTPSGMGMGGIKNLRSDITYNIM